MAMRVVSVGLELLDQDHGHWCNTCMLPSGHRFWVAVISPFGMHLQQRLWCDEHQGSRGVVVEA